jgi:uncharacterized protein YjbI with pentapeptide repeats
MLLYTTRCCSTLLDATQCYATLHDATQRYSTLLYASQLYSTLLDATQSTRTFGVKQKHDPGHTLCYSTLRYSTLLYATLRYSTLLYATLRYSTLLDATPSNSRCILFCRRNKASPKHFPTCYPEEFEDLPEAEYAEGMFEFTEPTITF